MRVIPPIVITDAKLISSSVVEVASAAYVPGTTYALNATASVAGALGLITEYKSLQAGNVDHTPASSPSWWVKTGDTYQVYSAGATYALGEYVIDPVAHLVYKSYVAGNIGQSLTDTTKWQKIGYTNRWAMFDLKSNRRTVVPGSFTYVIAPGERVNSIGLGWMSANHVEISVTSGGTVVYTATADLNEREVFNGADYCFLPFETRESLIRFDLPLYSDGVITITASVTEGNVEVGAFGVGMYVYIGDIQYNPEVGEKNFSTVNREFDGTLAEMMPRLSIPDLHGVLDLNKMYVNRVRKLMVSLNARVAFWCGIHDDTDGYFDALFIIGFYTNYKINPDAPVNALFNLDLEGISNAYTTTVG